MDPMTERVIEDGFWLLVLMALIGFFWFHDRARVEPIALRGLSGSRKIRRRSRFNA